MLTIWSIWKERNNQVFNKLFRTTQQVLTVLQDEAKHWILAGAKELKAMLPAAPTEAASVVVNQPM